MKLPGLLACMVLLGAAPAAAPADYPNTATFGVPFSETETWYRQCMAVQSMAPPPQDLPVRPPAPCDATALYYDALDRQPAGSAAWKQVRECAIAMDDKTVLMMLYANGFGVQKNLPLATKYACSLNTLVAKAEMEARVAYLSAGNSSKRFDFCDHITSGANGALCASVAEQRNQSRRNARLANIERRLPSAARQALGELRRSAQAYVTRIETDMHGTAAVGLAIDQQGRMMDEFVEDVSNALAGTPAQGSEGELEQVNAALENRFRAVLAMPAADGNDPGRIGQATITRADVEKAQAAWHAYAKAWQPFLAACACKTDPVALQTMLAKRRIDWLDSMMGYMP